MAQNLYASFHVPQQNRKNKLRVTSIKTQTNQDQTNFPLTDSQEPTSIFSFSSLQNLKDFNFQPVTDQCLSLSLPLHQFEGQSYSPLSGIADLLEKKKGIEMTSLVPLGPFTGYASILKSSRFLKPALQILDDICGVHWENVELSSNFWSGSEAAFCERLDSRLRNSKLASMLDEVYKRYRLYCQQMQSVVASFDMVAGLGNAAPYISFAIKLVLKHFTFLKNTLLDKIQLTAKSLDEANANKKGRADQSSALNLSFTQRPVWRSQRGLPDQAVAVLKTWLFDHFLHPYPTDAEKQILAAQTGLSRTQVSNWFVNARVRLWRPMVEEVHSLESQQEVVARVPGPDTNHHNITSENVKIKRRKGLVDVSVKRQEQMNSASLENGVPFATALGIDPLRPLPMNIADHVNMQITNLMDSVVSANLRKQCHHFG